MNSPEGMTTLQLDTTVFRPYQEIFDSLGAPSLMYGKIFHCGLHFYNLFCFDKQNHQVKQASMINLYLIRVLLL